MKEQQRRAKATAKREARRARQKAAREEVDPTGDPLDTESPEVSASPPPSQDE